MRPAVTLMIVFMTIAGVGRAADRDWQTGTWGEVGRRSAVRLYIIETADVRLELQDTVPAGQRPLSVTPGAKATFALDRTSAYVREANGAEHRLLVTKRTPKAARAPAPPAYSALGGGHLVRAVTEDGRFVTLEDGSVWEIDSSAQFKTIEWRQQANITVRTAPGKPGFDYELINTEDDEGAQAKYVPRK